MEKLFLWMQDFDNQELDLSDRIEQLEDAVRTFNEENGTKHEPTSCILAYEDWKTDKTLNNND
jgi:hypothetical protein